MKNFEDLIYLFTSDESSRGIVRLNIAEGALLYKYCKKKSNGFLLEIGRKHGGSTAIMAASLSSGRLCSVDIVLHDRVANNIEEYVDRIDLITADTKKMKWSRPVDLLFVDGDHSYSGVKNDVKLFCPWVNFGGFLVMHDVVGKKSILQPIIDKLLKTDWEHEATSDSLLVLRRRLDSRQKISSRRCL